MAATTPIGRLEGVLESLPEIAIAVSGGVDSMTLAVVAGRLLGDRAKMYHAVSAAVPPSATERVRRYADREGWSLTVLDAGEMNDADYLANPVNRCFFCKHNLYSSIGSLTDVLVVSGTNSDDLSDYRPGLDAADNHQVRHPYVEAGIDKTGVREIARELALSDLSELPAAPCLSSRVETGIPIRKEDLAAIDQVESGIRSEFGASTVRCRRRSDAVVVELDEAAIGRLDDAARARIEAIVRTAWERVDARAEVRIAAYEMGSAFLR